jgi:hypothetical protein
VNEKGHVPVQVANFGDKDLFLAPKSKIGVIREVEPLSGCISLTDVSSCEVRVDVATDIKAQSTACPDLLTNRLHKLHNYTKPVR